MIFKSPSKILAAVGLILKYVQLWEVQTQDIENNIFPFPQKVFFLEVKVTVNDYKYRILFYNIFYVFILKVCFYIHNNLRDRYFV